MSMFLVQQPMHILGLASIYIVVWAGLGCVAVWQNPDNQLCLRKRPIREEYYSSKALITDKHK